MAAKRATCIMAGKPAFKSFYTERLGYLSVANNIWDDA